MQKYFGTIIGSTRITHINQLCIGKDNISCHLLAQTKYLERFYFVFYSIFNPIFFIYEINNL